jgi:hypothetical protein
VFDFQLEHRYHAPSDEGIISCYPDDVMVVF